MSETNINENNNLPDGYLKERDISRLFTLGKWVIGSITIIVSVAIFWGYQGVADYKSTLEKNTELSRKLYEDKMKLMAQKSSEMCKELGQMLIKN